MGYYSMALSEAAKKPCVTCLPWGLYQYNMLPMGVKVATNVFQEAMTSLFDYLEGVIVCMKIVSEVLRRLEYQGLQVNPLKSFWGQHQVEYLGFLITRYGIKSQQKKIQGILDMAEPKSPKQLRVFVRMINYYKSLWPKRSLKMAPLTAMAGKGTAFKWKRVHKETFNAVKEIVAQDTILSHPNY